MPWVTSAVFLFKRYSVISSRLTLLPIYHVIKQLAFEDMSTWACELDQQNNSFIQSRRSAFLGKITPFSHPVLTNICKPPIWGCLNLGCSSAGKGAPVFAESYLHRPHWHRSWEVCSQHKLKGSSRNVTPAICRSRRYVALLAKWDFSFCCETNTLHICIWKNVCEVIVCIEYIV